MIEEVISMDKVKLVWRFIDGYKTYAGLALIFVDGGLLALNIIDQKTFEVIATFAVTLTGVGYRHAISKLDSK